MELGIGLGFNFSNPSAAGGDPPPPWVQPYDRVVFVGASLIERTFGQSLVTPHAAATAIFKNAGLNVDVFGYGWSGYTLANGTPKVTEALAAFGSRTLFVVELGGNNISAQIPYSGQSAGALATLGTLFDGLVSACAGRMADVILCPETFRTYEVDPTVTGGKDDVFLNEAKGAQPFNDAIFIPKIAAAQPATLNSNGRPVVDLYHATRNIYDLFVDHSDGIHPQKPQGIRAFIGIFADRMAYRINGGPAPAPYVPSTTIGAGYEANPFTKLMVNFGTPLADANVTYFVNNIDVGLVNATARRLYTETGKSTGVFVTVTHPGPLGTSGYNTVSAGNTTGQALYTGEVYCDPVTKDCLFTAAGKAMTLAFSGLTPGASYQIAAVGSRTNAGARSSRLTDANGVFVEWNSSAIPAANPAPMVCVANGSGAITLTLSCTAGTFAYLSGLTLKPV